MPARVVAASRRGATNPQPARSLQEKRANLRLIPAAAGDRYQVHDLELRGHSIVPVDCAGADCRAETRKSLLADGCHAQLNPPAIGALIRTVKWHASSSVLDDGNLRAGSIAGKSVHLRSGRGRDKVCPGLGRCIRLMDQDDATVRHQGRFVNYCTRFIASRMY